MAVMQRAGFFSLIFLFLRRMPSVWIGGFGASILTLLVLSLVGTPAAIACAAATVSASVIVTISIDRRRGLGRRMLFRGRRVSPRRLTALLIALGLVASVTTAIAANFVGNVQKRALDEARGMSRPNIKRGVY